MSVKCESAFKPKKEPIALSSIPSSATINSNVYNESNELDIRYEKSWAWKWVPSLLDLQSPSTIAGTLSARSFELFNDIPFNQFLLVASGSSSSDIQSFKFQHEALSWRLFRVCCRNGKIPLSVSKLQHIIQELSQMTADPFIIDTLKCTRSSVETERFTVPQFQELPRLIINPLREIFKQPEWVRNRSLKIVEFRFQKQYLSPEANWELPLGTHNALLERLYQTDIPTLAEEISRKDHDLYRHLTIEAIAQGHKETYQVRNDLGTRWNQLSRSVEECLLSESGTCQGIAQLSENLFEIHNFYSLTAVIHGAKSHNMMDPIVRKFDHFLDNKQCVALYQEPIGDSGALHFLPPAFLLARKGYIHPATNVIRACALYRIDRKSKILPNPPEPPSIYPKALPSATISDSDTYSGDTLVAIEILNTTRDSRSKSVFSESTAEESGYVSFWRSLFSCFAE